MGGAAIDLNPTERFSSRVADYVKYRPSYPAEVIDTLRSRYGLDGADVADIGSGPGNLTRLLLAHAASVTGIEPNAAMRAAGDELLADAANFRSLPGTAEQTGLEDASVSLITAAQAFHWFDRPAARREFERILRPGGHVALIWNERLTDASPFLAGYESLLRLYAPDYSRVNHLDRANDNAISEFFDPATVTVHRSPSNQVFDWDGLYGRVMSSSYAPQPGQTGHEEMVTGLRKLFNLFQSNGTVVFHYHTSMFVAQMD